MPWTTPPRYIWDLSRRQIYGRPAGGSRSLPRSERGKCKTGSPAIHDSRRVDLPRPAAQTLQEAGVRSRNAKAPEVRTPRLSGLLHPKRAQRVASLGYH